MSFSSTARRMQRFRQPQKMQGPLFPIEDNELIDAINDYKNIPDEDIKSSLGCKTDTLFDAANHMEVIEIDDVYMNENDDFNEKGEKENVSTNIQKGIEKTVDMFCKLNVCLSIYIYILFVITYI